MKKFWLVSIILLNCNWKQFNKKCIDSILLQTYKNYEIVFVNNKSTDWSLEEVQSLYKKEIEGWILKIVLNPKNTGFAWWNNLWVENSNPNSEYICLLNNDTVVEKNWLETLIYHINTDKELWAVSCIILDKWCEDKINHQIFVEHKKMEISIFWEAIWTNISDNELKNKFYYINALWWCCFLYKSNIVRYPFEPYYFIYAEDAYLSYLMLLLWYKMWVCLDTSIHHYWSPVFWKAPSPLKLFHWNKNQIINFLVFHPLFYRILLFPLFIIKEIAHLFMWAPLMRLKAKFRARIWIFQNYDKIRWTRKNINNGKIISYYDFIKLLSFKLSDKFFVNNKILFLLIDFWNIIFIAYGMIVKLIALFIDTIQKIVLNKKEK